MEGRKSKKTWLGILSVTLAVLLVCGVTACASQGDGGDTSSRESAVTEETTSSSAGSGSSQVEPVSEVSQPSETSQVSEVSQPAQPVQVTGITLTTYAVTLNLGQSQMPIVTMSPADAADKGEIWTSSDPSVATVDGLGRITGVTAGSCTEVGS